MGLLVSGCGCGRGIVFGFCGWCGSGLSGCSAGFCGVAVMVEAEFTVWGRVSGVGALELALIAGKVAEKNEPLRSCCLF